MPNDSFTLEIISPRGVVVSEPASEVKLKASDGEIGVLTHHQKYAGLLGTGVLEYYDSHGTHKRLVACEGFCNFAADKLTILTEAVDLPDEINPADYDQQRPLLQKIVEGKGEETHPQRLLAHKSLERLAAIDKLLGKTN